MKKKVSENLSVDAAGMEQDHEVQMARAQLFHLANDAIRLHKLLKNVSEAEGIEGWVQSKITLAADYIKSAADYIEYQEMGPMTNMSVEPISKLPENSVGAVATVATPLGTPMKKRKM